MTRKRPTRPASASNESKRAARGASLSVSLRLSQTTLAEIDAARGARPRRDWIRDAIERALVSR